MINDDIAWHFSYTFSKCLSAQTLHDPQTSVRDIIARYGETRISGANGLPAFTITGDIIPHGWDISKKKNSWGIAVWRAEEKSERLNVGGEGKIRGGDSLESFSDAPARYMVLVRREDPPTHSCWRSVVDDNGNPIFRNNICLEDRRLTSCDADAYTRAYPCVRARARVCVCAQHEVFHSRRDVSHSICSSIPRRS